MHGLPYGVSFTVQIKTNYSTLNGHMKFKIFLFISIFLLCGFKIHEENEPQWTALTSVPLRDAYIYLDRNNILPHPTVEGAQLYSILLINEARFLPRQDEMLKEPQISIYTFSVKCTEPERFMIDDAHTYKFNSPQEFLLEIPYIKENSIFSSAYGDEVLMSLYRAICVKKM